MIIIFIFYFLYFLLNFQTKIFNLTFWFNFLTLNFNVLILSIDEFYGNINLNFGLFYLENNMNDKVRLIFEKTKKVIFKKVSIYIIFFLSIILIIFYFSRPPIYNEEKVKYNDEVEILSEDEPYDDTQSAEVIPDLDKTEIDPERKYIDEPKPPTAKKKPKPADNLQLISDPYSLIIFTILQLSEHC